MPFLEKIFGHFEEVGKQVGVNEFLECLQSPRIVIGPEGAQDPSQAELDLLISAPTNAFQCVLEHRLHLVGGS